jgi:hypothetical protein
MRYGELLTVTSAGHSPQEREFEKKRSKRKKKKLLLKSLPTIEFH